MSMASSVMIKKLCANGWASSEVDLKSHIICDFAGLFFLGYRFDGPTQNFGSRCLKVCNAVAGKVRTEPNGSAR